MIDGQLNIFDVLYPKFKIDKPIRLIELFGGYGSQALALKYLDVEFEHWKLVEWAVKSIQAYKDIHFPDDNEDYSMLNNLSYEKLIDILYKYGISQNYNEPMNLEQIKRLGEKQVRKIFNNIVATHNLVNIQKVKGYSLEIEDTDKYCYIMTYSFPCQDLSIAGRGQGMKDTTTRSGMLWEVERILTECYELGSMPQLLLMENVPQVHSEDNLQDFNKWKDRLEQLGYKNYFQDLIATDYGIPQTRNRCFMVSILGEYNYTFPKPIPLKLKLKDLLEDNVPEKYYLTDRMINCFMAETQMGNITRKDRFMANLNRENPDIANSITTLNGSRVTDTFIFNRHIKETLEENQEKIKDGCYIDAYNRKIRDDDLSSVISTRVSASNDSFVVVNDKSLYTDIEKQLFTDDGNIRRYIDSDIIDKFEEGQMATTTFPNGYGHGPRTHDESISLNTIDRPSVKHNLRIRKLTPRECFRLMGVKDEDYDRCAKNQSDASLFHLAGDSICTPVLMAIFKEMIGSDKE